MSENVPSNGVGSEPKMMLRVFRDGVTLESEIIRDAPIAGEYAKGIFWGPLGRGKPPVIKFEIAVSDPVGITLADVQLNMSRI